MNYGGKRKNAGRKKGEEKVPIGKRVPKRWKQHFNDLVDRELKRLYEREKKQ